MQKRFEYFTVMTLKIHRYIQKIKTQEMAEFQLKSPHVSCLYYLYKEGALTVTELCEISGEDKSYLSHSLRYLEESGFIRCEQAARKRYNAPLLLTKKGCEVGAAIAGKIDRVLALAGEGLTEGEREIFYRCLIRITDNLENICENYEE